MHIMTDTKDDTSTEFDSRTVDRAKQDQNTIIVLGILCALLVAFAIYLSLPTCGPGEVLTRGTFHMYCEDPSDR